MPIQISYHGPYHVHRHRDAKGNYDLPAIQRDLERRVPDDVAHSSGIYIYLQRVTRGKWRARYVGVNTTNHLRREASSKSNVLNPEVFGTLGSRWLLFLTCEKPKGKQASGFKRTLLKLEKALILDLALKHHPLVNKQQMPKNERFDFVLSAKSKPAMIFKKLVRFKPPHV